MSVSMTMLLRISLYAVILGVFFGALYDVVRIIRVFLGVTSNNGRSRINKLYKGNFKNYLNFRSNKAFNYIAVFLGDLIFFSLVTLCFILFLFRFNYGIFRWFILLSSVLGFSVYYFTVGKVVMLFSRELSELIRLTANFIIFVVIQPIKLILRLLKAVLRRTVKPLFIRIKCAIDMRRKKRYTVLCKNKLNEIIRL